MNQEEYDKVIKDAYEEYEKIKQRALEEYDKIVNNAKEEYNKKIQPALKEYDKIRQDAREEYYKIEKDAYLEYKNIEKDAIKESNMCKNLGEIEFEGMKGELILHRDGTWNLEVKTKVPEHTLFEEVRFDVSLETGKTVPKRYFLGKVMND